jgi:hypothetical protein
MGQEKGEKIMSYMNSVTLIGFVGADPEQRQARNNGSKFTVLSVATQRSWKNAQDEWSSKTEWHHICVFRPRLAEYVATAIKKSATTKITSWSIRADVLRKLDRGEPEPEATASGSDASGQVPEPSDASPF